MLSPEARTKFLSQTPTQTDLSKFLAWTVRYIHGPNLSPCIERVLSNMHDKEGLSVIRRLTYNMANSEIENYQEYDAMYAATLAAHGGIFLDTDAAFQPEVDWNLIADTFLKGTIPDGTLQGRLVAQQRTLRVA